MRHGTNGCRSLAPPARAQASLSYPHISNFRFSFSFSPQQTFWPSTHPHHSPTPTPAPCARTLARTRTHTHTVSGNNFDLHCPVLSPRDWRLDSL